MALPDREAPRAILHCWLSPAAGGDEKSGTGSAGPAAAARRRATRAPSSARSSAISG